VYTYVPANVTDPCAAGSEYNSCYFRGTCATTAVIGQNSSDAIRSATICNCPTNFQAPTCAFAVLECTDCVVSFGWREGSDSANDGTSSIIGVGLDRILEFTIAGQPVLFKVADIETKLVSSALSRWPMDQTLPSSMQIMHFVPPMLVRANTTAVTLAARRLLDDPSHVAVTTSPFYQLASFRVVYDDKGVFSYNYSRVFYYSSASCVSEGVFGSATDGGCLECPSGCAKCVSRGIT
jgi:hypothetical protein